MKRRICFGISVALASLLSVVVLAQDVKTDWDKTFDFSTIHTFAIKIGTSWNNQLGENRVLTSVSDALTQKGWTRTDNQDQAGALVVIHGASNTKKTLNTFYDGWGGWGYAGMGMGGSTTTVSEYQEGTLVVDMFNPKTKNLIFRGTASDELSNDPFKNEKKLAKATEKMFKDFPPKNKK